MYKNALLLDGKNFAKTHQISAKRPTKYWLLFLKYYVLGIKKKKFRPAHLIFFIPILVLIILLFTGVEFELVFFLFVASVVVCAIIGTIVVLNFNHAFVPNQAFHDLAKFIISIKGDIRKNEIALRLNAGKIEANENLLDPYAIGLRKSKGVRYKPYEVERFKANFTLNDGSICTVALNQVTLRVTTTKRRSSGKTKTKMKRKHKFFHVLTLKLRASDYTIFNPGASKMLTDRFEISLKTENDYHYVKVKSKIKSLTVPSEIKASKTHKDAIYTEMLMYLAEHEIMKQTPYQNLIQ